MDSIWGGAIRNWAKRCRKSNSKGITFILLGVFFEVVLAYLRYRKVIGGAILSNERAAYSFLGYEGLAPFVVISSVLIFTGFSLLDVKQNFSKLASYTFLIYLIHGGIWDLMKKVSKNKVIFQPQTVLSIVGCVFIVFAVSLVIAIAYKKIWAKLDTKLKITDCLCDRLK